MTGLKFVGDDGMWRPVHEPWTNWEDARDLEVSVVPIYFQEKIHPQALVENLRDTGRTG